MTIYAFAIVIHSIGDETHLRLDQRYPLKELTEVYENENHQGKLNLNNFHGMKLYQNVTINLQKEQFQCAENFKKDSSRRRFNHIIKDYQGFYAISFFFRKKYINIYLKGGDLDLFNNLIEKLPKTIQTSSWKMVLVFN